MGDYNFPGAAEFGGQDGNFNCLPDYDSTKCPYIVRPEFFCIAKIDGSETSKSCLFCGDDYRKCEIFGRQSKESPIDFKLQARILRDLS